MFTTRFASRARGVVSHHLASSSTKQATTSTARRTLASVSNNLPPNSPRPNESAPRTSGSSRVEKAGILPQDRLEGAVGEHAGEGLKEQGGGTTELFGFEVTKKESSVGGKEKTDGRPIYLDAQATTPMDPRVLDTILPYLTDLYGNPHSRTHAYGWEAETAVEKARSQVASLIGASSKDIIFTSGATESNNMLIKGIARFYKAKRNHIITTQTEHKCVLDSCRYLSDQGFEVTYLPVKSDGLVDLDVLRKAIKPTTCLVSIMAVNNEIGVIQPMKEIGQLLRDIQKETKGPKILFHSDIAQATGKIPIDVEAMGLDAASISGHKLYGPKGVGAAYVRRRPRVRLEPLIHGGGQERGLRSGTVPTFLTVGLGEACRIASEEMESDHARIKSLADRLINGINERVDLVVRNGDPNGYPGCVNLSFSYVEGESLLMALKSIALSSGSACTSASLEPSYVLRSLGADEAMAHSSLRFGIGRFTTEEEIDFVVEKIVAVVTKLREMSPLWEMVQEGIDINTIEWSQ